MTKYFKISSLLIIFTLGSLNGRAQKITTFQKSIGGSSDDLGSAIVLMPHKGYIIAGATKSFGSGKSDILLIRTDSIGKKIWAQTYGGSDDDGLAYYLSPEAVDLV